MASKRERDDGEPEPQNKRAKKSTKRQHQNSGIDPTWGQKYVFSATQRATTIPVGEEADFEDDSEAMAYLNSVRQEAGKIPHLLVAPKVKIGPQLPADFQRNDADSDEDLDYDLYDDGTGDARGYYEDGAYTAAPDGWEEDDVDEAKALHEAYFSSVMDQYLRLRSVLNSEPPADARSRLSPSQPTSAAQAPAAIALWSRVLRTSDPHPLQLALMPKDAVLQALRVLLGGKFLRRGHTLPERTSRWTWALLARLPDGGELNHSEVGWVRDLGRRAVLLGRSLAEMAALRDELADGGLGAHDAVDGSSTDEDVMAEVEDLEVEGAMSPGDEDSESDKAKSGEEHKSDEEEPTNPSDGQTKPGEEATKRDDRPTTPGKGQATMPDNKGQATKSDETDPAEEGEIEEDVAMDTASDSEEGEVTEDLEEAKSRLLARLETPEQDEQEAARQRSRENLRATLNMILTVAGEFYGQRDLLEFREPFVGM